VLDFIEGENEVGTVGTKLAQRTVHWGRLVPSVPRSLYKRDLGTLAQTRAVGQRHDGKR
jgi:hypothetical protein